MPFRFLLWQWREDNSTLEKTQNLKEWASSKWNHIPHEQFALEEIAVPWPYVYIDFGVGGLGIWNSEGTFLDSEESMDGLNRKESYTQKTDLLLGWRSGFLSWGLRHDCRL